MTNSIFAGVMIAIGATIYLNAPSRIIGAILFAIGLIIILEYKFSLYTGKVGAYRTSADFGPLAAVLGGNAIGCLTMLAFPSTAAEAIWMAKLTAEPPIILVKAILCGMLIQFCVHQHKTQSRAVSIGSCLIAIPAFILAGFEHSIADMCFMISANAWSKESIGFVLLVAFGNALGAIAMSMAEEENLISV